MKNNKLKLAKIFRPVWLGIFKPGRSENNGFTLLLSVLVTSIILSVGMGIFSIMTKELKLSSMGRESQIAFYAADAGVECFFFWEIKHPGLADTAFNSANTIDCAGNSVANNFSGNVSDFTLPLSNNSCVKVNIKKKTIGSSVETTVESRGYNTACNSTSPFKVERAIQLVSTKQAGGGMYVPPNPPTNIVVNSNSFHKINLSWNNSLGANSYTVYRSDDNNNFTAAASGITGQNYTDGGLVKNTTYYYYVTAVGDYGESDPSGADNAKTNDTTAVTFVYNGTDGTDGSSQPWSVLSGVQEVRISAYGASGGAAGGGGGKGGYTSAIFNVNPSDTLYVNVGGTGEAFPGCASSRGAFGGFNGGGDAGKTLGCPGTGGGGASDVRQNGTALGNRIIVAGGGGGGGGGSTARGGDGCAGGCAGGNGKVVGNGGGFGGGGGNSNVSGGVGGAGVLNGGDGIIGSGGKGGDGTWSVGMGSGGGGGGGYFGGGGGGSGNDTGLANDGGGGGGGSSYTSGLYPKYQDGGNTGNGLIIIEY